MRAVSLVSGGLDSTFMAYLMKEASIEQVPVFVNYGQRSLPRELKACRAQLKRLDLASPTVIDVSNWGKTVGSGLTRRGLRLFEDAFLPGRNLMFLLVGASIAYRRQCSAVAIGLLADRTTIFPDQTKSFCTRAAKILAEALGTQLSILTPLKHFTKADIVAACRNVRIGDTYSCHAGTRLPCGRCVACREYRGIEV